VVLRRLIFWEFPRGSWQYDLVVGLILAFIFLTPRGWFRDQPRTPAPVHISDGVVYWLEPDLLAGVPESERIPRAASMLSSRSRKAVSVTRVDPITDSEAEIKGYLAVTTQ
jgi:hypothetical protein